MIVSVFWGGYVSHGLLKIPKRKEGQEEKARGEGQGEKVKDEK